MAAPAKSLEELVEDLAASMDEIVAGSLHCPQADVVLFLAIRLRQPPQLVRLAVLRRQAAGTMECNFAGPDNDGPLLSARFVPERQRRNRRPRTPRPAVLRPDPIPPLRPGYVGVHPQVGDAPGGRPVAQTITVRGPLVLDRTCYRIMTLLRPLAFFDGTSEHNQRAYLKSQGVTGDQVITIHFDHLRAHGLFLGYIQGFWVDPAAVLLEGEIG